MSTTRTLIEKVWLDRAVAAETADKPAIPYIDGIDRTGFLREHQATLHSYQEHRPWKP